MKPDSVHHPEDTDAGPNAQRDLLQHLKLHLDKETHRFQELNKNLKEKEEEVAKQSKTIEELRVELDKEKSNNSELQDKLKQEKDRSLGLENKIAKFERYVFQGMRAIFGGNSNEEEGEGLKELTEVGVNSAGMVRGSEEVTMSTMTMNCVMGPLTCDEPQPPQVPQQPQQNLKRKLGDEEAETDMQLKRTPQPINRQVDNIDGRGSPKVPSKPSSSDPIPTPIPNPTGTPNSAVLSSTTQSQSNPIPALPKLPALVFQFQSTQIKMGMFTEGKPQILKNASGSESTPFIVGVTNQGILVHGDGVRSAGKGECTPEKPPSKLWKHWWVTDKLIKHEGNAWSANPKLHDGERHKIAVEFLIGFILHNLKRHVETGMKGTCSTAVITVPFWYSSIQRTQVKNGVRLAGFPHVFLVNEGPAAIFGCPSRDQQVSTFHNILVISENSNQIDASIYSYTSAGAKRLIMIGHSGHYSLVGVELGDRDAAIVENICTEALKNMQDKKNNPLGSRSVPAELITFSESKKWGPILEQVGKQFVSPFSNLNVDMDYENAVVLGAAHLSQKPVEIQAIVSDKLAYDVLAKCVREPTRVIFEKVIGRLHPKNNAIPDRTRLITISHTFPPGCHFLKICQLVLNRHVELFRITMRRPIPSSQRIVVNLIVTEEGVVKFKDMVYASTDPNNPTVEKAPVEDYVWKAPVLSLDDLRKARALIKHYPIMQKGSGGSLPKPVPVNDAKHALLQKCAEMKKKLDLGNLQFKSDLIKEAFVIALESAGGVARDMNATGAEVQGQMDILSNWSVHDKYNT